MSRSAILLGGVMFMALAGCSGEREADRRAGHDQQASSAPIDYASLKDFTKIAVTGPDNVIVTVGQPFAVKAEGEGKALAGLEITVADGELRIGRREGWKNFWGGMGEGATIHVSMPAIAAARLTGSANVTIDRAEAPALEFQVTGSGDLKVGAVKAAAVTADVTGSGNVELRGAADSVKLSATGSGDIDADDLKAGGGSISVLGSGDVDLASDGAIDIRIMGSGNVDVKGKAQCKVSAMGSGEARCGA